MSRIMREPIFCICENKDADHNREADQRLCFYSTSLIQNSKLLACFYGWTTWFASDLFGNHIVGFLMMRLKYAFAKPKPQSQLCSLHVCTADQRFCFRTTDNMMPLLSKSVISSCNLIGRFVLDLVGTPEDPFSLVVTLNVFISLNSTGFIKFTTAFQGNGILPVLMN